ncbi:O-antigen ligase family protein [Alteromonas ponticola]|uniref:O-antigen ligase family protein n=1 Tax=Alteromonas ponticola TaxID=2720613 RepID=A0ABX1R1Y5_9ALTE|nr:O-antigen ligase family protein [Alteromonas ponticola]NMH60479.1 O-antigen ligase family protein [Alteromonas ponticola]
MTGFDTQLVVHRSASLHRIALILLGVTLCVFPWLHGAELIWEQLFLCGAIFAAFLLSTVSWQPDFNTPTSLKIAAGVFVVWLVGMSLYVIPIPINWLKSIAPTTYQWHQSGSANTYLPISVYPHISLIEIIKLASLGALFFGVFRLCDTFEKIKALLYLMVVSATTTALYSLLNFATSGAFEISPAIPPWDLSWNEGVRGTFSYKNQYALFLVMSLAVAGGLFVEKWHSVKRRQSTSSTSFTFFAPKIFILFICIVILLLTLFNTSSRGALVSMVLAAGCVVGIVILSDQRFRKMIFKPKMLAISTLILLAAIAVFSQTSVFKRFSESQFEDNGRIMLHQTALKVINEFGPVGTGPGTYPYVQHHFKHEKLGNSAMSKRAHNDYLETIATLGFAGALMLLIILLSLIYGTLRKTHFQAGLVNYGIYVGLLAYMIQSSFDVNISAFYLPTFFVVLLAVGNRLTSTRIRYQAAYQAR